jgi:hypothetical protein
MADHYISHGMVPGGGPVKMSDQLAAGLLKAGWNQLNINKFATALSGSSPNDVNRTHSNRERGSTFSSHLA